MRLMALFQNTYLGAPMIWYGDEVGMFGADDPRNRMPMWWDDMMPYDSPDYTIDTELRDFFRTVFALRNAHPVLRTGDYLTLATDDAKDSIAYLRYSEGSKHAFLVVLNNSSAAQNVRVPVPAKSVLPKGFKGEKVVFGAAKLIRKPKGGDITVHLKPVSGVVIKLKK